MLTVFLTINILLSTKAEASSKYARKDKYASIVMDVENGQVLNQINADKQLHPASLTKMMTLYLTFDALKSGKLRKNTYLRASWRAASQKPSSLGLVNGDAIRVEQAILALVTKSANDVAVVLAEALGGSEENFAEMMTAKAQELGMSRTVFKNASGLHHRQQISTARDMAILSKALIKDHPEYYHYFKTTSFKYKDMVFKNHNALMKSYQGMDGLKTGYIRASGFNLASSVNRDGKRVVAVVFGGKTAPARNMIMKHLLDRAYAKLSPINKIKHQQVAMITPARRPSSQKNQPVRVASINLENDYDNFVQESFIDKIQRRYAPNAAMEREQGDAASEDEVADKEDKAWSIQIGAFRDKYRSLQAIKNAKDTLGYLIDADDAIAPLVTERGVIYRARITGVSLNTARSACDILKDNCLILTAD